MVPPREGGRGCEGRSGGVSDTGQNEGGRHGKTDFIGVTQVLVNSLLSLWSTTLKIPTGKPCGSQKPEGS